MLQRYPGATSDQSLHPTNGTPNLIRGLVIRLLYTDDKNEKDIKPKIEMFERKKISQSSVLTEHPVYRQ